MHRWFSLLELFVFVALLGAKPTWEWHTVQKSETLFGLAHRYRTTVSHLVQLNGWTAPRPLKVGERIKVPLSARSYQPTLSPQTPSHPASKPRSPAPLPAPKTRVVQVQVGKAIVVTLPKLRTVSIANPEVADVQVLSPDHVGVLGKSVGNTTLIVVADGRTFTMEVQVVPEPFLKERLQALIGLPTVQVDVVKGAIVLSGTVPSQAERDRITAVARLFAATVLDLLRVEEPKPAEPPKPPRPSPEEIERTIGIKGVKVRMVDNNLVLEGMVERPEDVTRAEKVAVLLAPKVVNLLQVRPLTAEELQALIAVPTVKVRETAEAFVLEGEVSTQEELQRINEIAAQARRKVINWVKVVSPPPPPPPSPPPSFAERVKEAIGIPTIDVKGDEKGLVLVGTVATQAEKEKALRIARFLLGLPPVPTLPPSPPAGVTPYVLPGTGVMPLMPSAPSQPLQGAPSGQQPQILDLIEVKGGKQIRVELRVVEINRGALRQLGVSYPELQTGVTFGQVVNPATGELTGFEQRTPITAVLQALEQKNLARTLSAPSAVVLSGQEARFNVGGEIPIPVSTVAPGIGTTATVEFRPFGIVLTVRPTIEPSGKIALHVNTEVSELDFTIAVNIAGATIPGKRIRTATTTVELASGETLVMSGLVQRIHQEIVNRVPFLSKLPILGELFTSRRFQQGETELAILVTPVIVEPNE